MNPARERRLNAFRTVHQFPALSKMHATEHASSASPRRRSDAGQFPRSVLSASPPGRRTPRASPRSRRVKKGDKPSWKPVSPSKAREETSPQFKSVNCDTPYIEVWKIRQQPNSEKKKHYVCGEFYPVGQLEKKGRMADNFINAPDPHIKKLQMKRLKERSKKNLIAVRDRHREMLKSKTLDVDRNGGRCR